MQPSFPNTTKACAAHRSYFFFFIKIAMVSLSCMQCMPVYDLPFWWGSGRKRVLIWCYQASFWLAGTINTSIQRSRVRIGAGNVIFPRHRFVVGLHSSRVFIADARKRVPRCTLRPVFGARVCRVPNRECQTPKLVRLNAVFTFWAESLINVLDLWAEFNALIAILTRFSRFSRIAHQYSAAFC